MNEKIRIICISDTHGNNKAINDILPVINSYDYLFFLGDGHNDFKQSQKLINCQTYAVRGNCDFFCGFPFFQVVEISGVRFFLTHGHQYGVKKSYINVSETAKKQNCSFAVFGHTHIPKLEKSENLNIINVGSLAYPRSGKCSYVEITGDKDTLSANIIEL